MGGNLQRRKHTQFNQNLKRQKIQNSLEVGHLQHCRRSVVGDQRLASPWVRKERLRQLVLSDLEGSRQPHFLSWAER